MKKIDFFCQKFYFKKILFSFFKNWSIKCIRRKNLKLLGEALLKVAQTEFKLGAAEREFISTSANNTLLPFRRFLEGDIKTIQVFC